MQIEITEELLKNSIDRIIKESILNIRYDIEKEIQNEYKKQYLNYTYGNWSVKQETINKLKEEWDKFIDEAFNYYIEKQLSSNLRKQLNSKVRDSLDNEIKRIKENIKIWFKDEEDDIYEETDSIMNDSANSAYESWCRDWYNQR